MIVLSYSPRTILFSVVILNCAVTLNKWKSNKNTFRVRITLRWRRSLFCHLPAKNQKCYHHFYQQCIQRRTGRDYSSPIGHNHCSSLRRSEQWRSGILSPLLSPGRQAHAHARQSGLPFPWRRISDKLDRDAKEKTQQCKYVAVRRHVHNVTLLVYIKAKR